MYKSFASASILAASILLLPTLVHADSCSITNNFLFFAYVINLDNTSCDDRGNFETIIRNIGGCGAITNSVCNPAGTTGTFSFNQAIFCGDSQIESAINTFTGRTVTCA
jgi:hypothetical protein